MSSYDVCKELGQNFIDYAYAVNTDRAIPNAADGLKPVARRILWSMAQEKFVHNKSYVKCARVVGDVIGKYHPHGDTSVYDAMTRLAQEWNMRYPIIDWHGNKGNIGGDGAAAMRYTECRLTRLAEESFLGSINKKVVDMQPNYSEDIEEPVLLPAIFPNLLCNQTSGIGVALACNWLPHNLNDIVNHAIIPYLLDEEVNIDKIYPDFPTGGTIVNQKDISSIYKTGKGKVIVEGNYIEEQRNGKNLLVFTEIPYGTKIEYSEQGKSKGIIPQLREAIQKEKIDGIEDVRDESAKQIRIVLELSPEANIDTVLAQVFMETDLRQTYNANQIALVGKTPKLLTLANVLEIYKQHTLSCLKREFEFDYQKYTDRIEILEGLIFATQRIDNVIRVIRGEATTSNLQTVYPELTNRQVNAILDMKLGRLSKLEEEKLIKEKEQKEELAAWCKSVIESEQLQIDELIKRLKDMRDSYGDNRRTKVTQKQIIKPTAKKTIKQIIPQDVIVTYNSLGYIQSIPVKVYRAVKNDFIVNHFKTQTTDMILLFSSFGKVYRINVSSIAECGVKDKGTAVGSLISLENGEKILNIFSMNIDEKHPYIVGFTKSGLVKKSDKTIYLGETQNKRGLKAAGLNDNDEFISWFECNGDYAVLISHDDYIIQFELEKVNPVGKTAKGVKGISLAEGDYVIKAIVCNPAVDRIEYKKYNKVIHGIKVQSRAGKGKKYV